MVPAFSKFASKQPVRLSALTDPFLGQEGKAISYLWERKRCLITSVSIYVSGNHHFIISIVY